MLFIVLWYLIFIYFIKTKRNVFILFLLFALLSYIGNIKFEYGTTSLAMLLLLFYYVFIKFKDILLKIFYVIFTFVFGLLNLHIFGRLNIASSIRFTVSSLSSAFDMSLLSWFFFIFLVGVILFEISRDKNPIFFLDFFITFFLYALLDNYLNFSSFRYSFVILIALVVPLILFSKNHKLTVVFLAVLLLFSFGYSDLDYSFEKLKVSSSENFFNFCNDSCNFNSNVFDAVLLYYPNFNIIDPCLVDDGVIFSIDFTEKSCDFVNCTLDYCLNDNLLCYFNCKKINFE